MAGVHRPILTGAKRMITLRLGARDLERARACFSLMAEVFSEEHEPLSDDYLGRLLSCDRFWAFVAMVGDEIVGGLTAHELPMTRAEASELFIYDLAVRADHQRRGVGRALVYALCQEAAAEGISDVFVPADDEDLHALDFYHALGGVPSSVTLFAFSADQASRSPHFPAA